MPRSLSFVLRVLSALLAVACNVATPQKPSNPTVSGGRCQTVASVNWKAAIGDNIYINPDSADVMMPEDLKTCTVHFGTVDVPHRIDSYVRFRFNLHANKVNGVTPHGAESGTYSFISMNTAATQGGTGLGPIARYNRANWVTLRQQYWNNDNTILYEDIGLPLTVYLGYPTEADKRERDSLHVEYWSRVTRSDPNFPDDTGVYIAATEVIVGDNIQGSIGGLSGGWVGVEQGFQFVPYADSMGYRYTWYVNGVPQTTWKGFYSMWWVPTLAGDYTIRLDQQLVDTTYVLTKLVTVPIVTAVSGPTVVNPWEANGYSASLSYGTAPYSYSWTVDGSYYSSGSSITTPAWNQLTEHMTTLTVSDANGATGYAELQVFTSGGECNVNDPGCNIEDRRPPVRAAQPPRPAPKPANARLWELLRKP